MILPTTHIHVSERENAHRWPDGRYDNARWEDCAWDVAIEFLRAMGHFKIPATHAEAEALRAASGEDTWSGSNHTNVRLGVSRRYRILLNPTVFGFADLWTKLRPGTVASVGGRMGVFPYGHRLRRHDKPFRDTHQWTVFRLDNTDRVWVCDPLGPKEGYRGEWVTKWELKRFVEGSNLGHFVGKMYKPPTKLEQAIATLQTYIARLSRVKNKTPEQIKKLATYKARLAEYIKRLKGS